jgi:hypothetical protein
VLTASLQDGELPLRTAFPIMMTNAITWFRGTQGEFREALATGSIVEVDLGRRTEPTGADPADPERTVPPGPGNPVFLRDPHGDERPLPAEAAKLTVGPLDQCGVWQIAPRSTRTRRPPAIHSELACNLVNAQESNLQHQGASADVFPQAAGLGPRPIWFYLAAAAMVLTVVEWFLYQRRWIR